MRETTFHLDGELFNGGLDEANATPNSGQLSILTEVESPNHPIREWHRQGWTESRYELYAEYPTYDEINAKNAYPPLFDL